jgi:riboflavin biosynthesis pyrimidine reductase
VHVFTETAGEVAGRGADVRVHRSDPGALRLADALALLREDGVAAVLCEGGPTPAAPPDR